jgi:hypothetical protein
MSLCKAFDALHNPCLNETSDGHLVCEIHTNFYNPAVWFHKYVLVPDPNPRQYSIASSEKLKKVYKTAILEGLVPIKWNHFRDLEDSGKSLGHLADYYLLCCMQPGVDPLWSMPLFNVVIMWACMLHKPDNYKPYSYEDKFMSVLLDPLFNSLRKFDYMMATVLYSVCSHSNLDTFTDVDKNIDNPRYSLLQYIKDHPKFTSELLWMDSVAEQSLTRVLSRIPNQAVVKKIKEFLESIPELRLAERKKRVNLFSERAQEIREIAWHPKRVRHWCLDTETLADINERWPLIGVILDHTGTATEPATII